MNTIWVSKDDAKPLYDYTSQQDLLSDCYRDLCALIGAEHIIDMEKRVTTTFDQHGYPMGNINAFEITELGYMLLINHISGPQGFKKCTEIISHEFTHEFMADVDKVMA